MPEFHNEHPSFPFFHFFVSFFETRFRFDFGEKGEKIEKIEKIFMRRLILFVCIQRCSLKQLRILSIFVRKIFLEIFFHLSDLLSFSREFSVLSRRYFLFFSSFFFSTTITLFRVKINIFRQTYYVFPTCSFFFFFQSCNAIYVFKLDLVMEIGTTFISET